MQFFFSHCFFSLIFPFACFPSQHFHSLPWIFFFFPGAQHGGLLQAFQRSPRKQKNKKNWATSLELEQDNSENQGKFIWKTYIGCSCREKHGEFKQKQQKMKRKKKEKNPPVQIQFLLFSYNSFFSIFRNRPFWCRGKGPDTEHNPFRKTSLPTTWP